MPPTRATRDVLDLQTARIDIEKEFGEQGFRRGIDYVSGKRIQITSAQMDEERVWHLVASVKGSLSEAYITTVEMEFFQYGIEIFAAECTCPVGLNCKHAAGLAYLWTTLQPQKNGTLTGATAEPMGAQVAGIDALISPAAESVSATSVASNTVSSGLAADLSQWLRASFEQSAPLARGESAEGKASSDFVAYLLTERGELTLAKARRLKGGETKLNVQAASLSWINYQHAAPNYVDNVDEPILRMLAATIGMQSSRPVLQLNGATGAQLLRMVLATERLWMAPSGFTDTETRTKALRSAERPALSAPLTLAAAEPVTLTWSAVETSLGERMALRALVGSSTNQSGASLPIVALDPPLVIDIHANVLRPMQTNVSAATLARLIALPPLKADDTSAWAFVADALRELPDFAAIPRCPTVADVEAPLPIPQPVLRFALIEFDVSVGWGRNASLQGPETPAPEIGRAHV